MNTVNGVHSSECGLTPKALRRRGRNEKGADNIKNVTMFLFCTTIFVERCKDKTIEEEYHDCLKRIRKIYHYILEHYLIERL